MWTATPGDLKNCFYVDAILILSFNSFVQEQEWDREAPQRPAITPQIKMTPVVSNHKKLLFSHKAKDLFAPADTNYMDRKKGSCSPFRCL